MKAVKIFGAIMLLTVALAGCNGDHSANDAQHSDTTKSMYGAQKDTSKLDTGKITTTTGDASDLDNSASGGTKVARPDSAKK